MRPLFSLCLVLATGMAASDAAAEVDLPALPTANSGPAKSLDRDMRGFANSVAHECVANNPASWEASFKSYEDAIAKFTDANDKAAWTKYVSEVRAIYKSRLDGLPGQGTFPEIRAKHEQAKVDITAKWPQATELPTDVAQAKQLVARVAEYTAYLDGVLATYKAVLDSRCNEKLTGNWWPLKNDAESSKQQARNLLSGLASKEADAINRWVSNLPQGKQEPGKDWWTHIGYAGKVLHEVGKAQRFAGKLDILHELAPSLDASKAAMLEKHTTVVRDYMANNAPLIKQLLGEILLPKLKGTAKQVAEFKKYMKDFDTGTIIGAPVAHKMTTSTFQEWDGGRKYTVVKKAYTNYYVWKPKQPAEGTPAIEGIAPDQICELWSRNLVSYDKGGPSHAPLKKWRGDQNILQGFTLCANKDKRSPLPYKD
jgi:hypothetical protein